jgi:enamine deaminase RidA (YjgF/YER057c/UK114 family)
MSDRYIDSNHRMSQVVVHGNTAYLAGQVAADATVGMRGQTEQILQGIDQLLAKAGTDKSHILSATIWITDMAEFQEMHTAWDAWVIPGRMPARACVTGNLAKPEWKVEVMLIAAIPA